MTLANLLGALDGPDLLIILLIVLLLFGGAKLPGLARSLGEAKREFHEATAGPATTATERSGATSDETVTISKAELDTLRANAQPQSSDPNPN